MKIKNVFYVVTILAITHSSIHTMRPIDQQLLDAVKNGQTEQVQALLAHGADPNNPDDTGWTILHDHVQSKAFCKMEIVELLLKYGANLNTTDSAGLTLFHCAKHKKIIAMLLLKGANIPDNLSPKKIAQLDEITEEINEIITHRNIFTLLKLQDRKNNPVAETLSRMTLSRPNECASADIADLIMKQSTLLRLPSEILGLRQQTV